jgi:hypothetical protein
MTLYPAPLADTVLDTQNVAITSARPFPECRLVYLLSIFPAILHTFFLNEVLCLARCFGAFSGHALRLCTKCTFLSVSLSMCPS